MVALAEDQLGDVGEDSSSVLGLVGNIVRLASDNAQVGVDDSLLGGRGMN